MDERLAAWRKLKRPRVMERRAVPEDVQGHRLFTRAFRGSGAEEILDRLVEKGRDAEWFADRIAAIADSPDLTTRDRLRIIKLVAKLILESER